MAREKQLSRKLAHILPIIGVIIGMTLVFVNAVLYFGDANMRVLIVSVGILLLASGVWYAGNPYLKNERRYLELRAEVDSFIGLVRELNAAGHGKPQGELNRVNAAMHESVDRMAQLAGKPDVGSP